MVDLEKFRIGRVSVPAPAGSAWDIVDVISRRVLGASDFASGVCSFTVVDICPRQRRTTVLVNAGGGQTTTQNRKMGEQK
jgi:hypothetical protein